jgi:hypothetical protein
MVAVNSRRQKTLRILNEFAQTFLPGVSVRFSSLGRVSGQSDLQRKIIYVSPVQAARPDAIGLGLTYAYRIGPKYRSMKLTRYEMYFLTTLHEIGHFKVKERVPTSYHRLQKEISELAIRYKGDQRMIELSFIESRIKRKNGETSSAWKLRIADFMSWLATGETISHHMKVENWAIDEFERNRQRIASLLQNAGLIKAN